LKIDCFQYVHNKRGCFKLLHRNKAETMAISP